MEPRDDGERSHMIRLQDETRRFDEQAERVLERLEGLASSLESERTRLQTEVEALLALLRNRDAGAARLHEEIAAILQDNRRLSREQVEVQRHSASIARLYVASLQLHASPERDEVLGAIRDIAATMIGCEEVAVYTVARPEARLVPIAAFGLERERLAPVSIGSGVIGRTALSGDRYVRSGDADPEATPEESELSACIPLKVEATVTGVIVLFRLLSHKLGLDESDQELLDLLSGQAATALYCADLHARAAPVST